MRNITSKITRRHIVTKASDDGTFQVGDHILFEDDGSISCIEAMGWIPDDEVADATAGMESVPDIEWAERKKARLIAELAELGIEQLSKEQHEKAHK